MSVAVDLELTPSLDEVRALAREHTLVPLRHTFIADCETPVSAFLKLRDASPCFLLESAEQGRLGRYSFLGFRPRAVLRYADQRELLVSGLLDGNDVAQRPAVVDAPVEKGHVVMFANNPIYRGETIGSYFLVFNTLLNWDNLNAGRKLDAK